MSNSNVKIKVGILRGGTKKYYDSSLSKGADIILNIYENLSDKYKIIDIFVDKKGIWYVNGIPVSPINLTYKVDIIWNLSQDSSLSMILNNLSIPNIGNEVFLRVFKNNRNMLKRYVKDIGIKTPRSIIFPLYQKDFDGLINKYAIKKAKEVFEKFSAPWIVKSFIFNSSLKLYSDDTQVVKSFWELINAIEERTINKKNILIEEFILGKTISVHSILGFRGEDIYVLPIKNFSASEKNKITTLAKKLHKHFSTEYYLKSNFVFRSEKDIFLTDVDFMFDIKKESHFNQSCRYVGAEMYHIIEHVLKRALDKKV